MTRKTAVNRYPSLLLTQNKHRFYFTTIPVSDLFPYCFVSRRQEDNAKGFQRELNKSRAVDIAKYLKEGTGSIPTNIVLSAQQGTNFSYVSRGKQIAYERIEKSFLVLDGQHRLWGYHICKELYAINHRVPVAIYEGLSRVEEAKLFIDINTRQVGVPAALLLDIKQVAQIETQKEQIVRTIFDRLAADARSPMLGKMSSARSVAGKISRVTFNRTMEALLDSPLVRDAEPEKRYGLILNFLTALEAELEDKGLIVRSAFFEAAFDVFDLVIRQSISEYGNAKVESLRKAIRPVAKFDYSGSISNKGALKQTMLAALESTLKLTDDML